MRILIMIILISGNAEALIVKNSKVILESFNDYSLCHEKNYSGSWCHEALLKWVKNNPKDAFRSAKATRLYMNHWLAVPLFALSMNNDDFNCKDQDLKLAVLGGLNLARTGNEKVIADAEEIALKKCPKELIPAVKEAAVLDSNLFVNICSKLPLTGIKKSKCDSLDI